MNSFLCRVMTLVFLFNCLTPATGWGQPSRRTTATKSSLEKQVTSKVQNAQQANTPAAQFARADKEVRDAHNAHFAQADSIAQQADSIMQANRPSHLETLKQIASQNVNRHLVQSPSSLYVAPQRSPKVDVESVLSAKIFLNKVTRNEIPFEQLVDYADPMDPNPGANNLLTIAYAAEVISNTVGEAMQLDSAQYDLNEFQTQLVQMQARLLYRLALLGFQMPSYTANPAKDPASLSQAALQNSWSPISSHRTMAVAGLRMALLKIHQFYQAKNLPDPADEYQKEMLVKQSVNSTLIRTQLHDGMSLSPRFTQTAQQQAAQTQVAARRQAAQAVKDHGNLAVFMEQFIREFKQAVDEEPEQGSAEYQYAQIRAEYATAYALEYDPE